MRTYRLALALALVLLAGAQHAGEQTICARAEPSKTPQRTQKNQEYTKHRRLAAVTRVCSPRTRAANLRQSGSGRQRAGAPLTFPTCFSHPLQPRKTL
jgi:hypothetical protein